MDVKNWHMFHSICCKVVTHPNFKKVHNFEIKKTKSNHLSTHEGGHITRTIPEQMHASNYVHAIQQQNYQKVCKGMCKGPCEMGLPPIACKRKI